MAFLKLKKEVDPQYRDIVINDSPETRAALEAFSDGLISRTTVTDSDQSVKDDIAVVSSVSHPDTDISRDNHGSHPQPAPPTSSQHDAPVSSGPRDELLAECLREHEAQSSSKTPVAKTRSSGRKRAHIASVDIQFSNLVDDIDNEDFEPAELASKHPQASLDEDDRICEEEAQRRAVFEDTIGSTTDASMMSFEQHERNDPSVERAHEHTVHIADCGFVRIHVSGHKII
jgi:hypothetical protein